MKRKYHILRCTLLFLVCITTVPTCAADAYYPTLVRMETMGGGRKSLAESGVF